MIDESKFNTYQIKFHWDIKFILGDKTFSPKSIKSIQKINDYENNFFPIFKLELLIQDIYDDLIFKSQNRLLCNLLIKRRFYNSDINDTSKDEVIIKEEVALNDMFVCFFSNLPSDYMPSDNLITENDLGKEEEKAGTDNLSGIHMSPINVYLYHLDSLISYKSVYNKIFDSATVGTGIGYLIDQTDLIKKAIVDIPDNMLEYKNLILLPSGLRNSFYNLQYRYGVYLNGMYLFLDNGTLYCLKALTDKHQYEKGKAPYTTIKLYQSINSLHFPYIVGVSKSDNSYYFEADGRLIKRNYDTLLGELLGDIVVYSNFDKILSSIEVNGTNIKTSPTTTSLSRGKRSHNDTGIKLDIDYDELNNDYNIHSNIRREKMNMSMPITVNGCDLDCFSPEKRVVLEIDDQLKNQEYGGSYCIRNAIYVFTPDKDINKKFETICSCQVTISKVPDELN